jgi:hypothetical protein
MENNSPQFLVMETTLLQSLDRLLSQVPNEELFNVIFSESWKNDVFGTELTNEEKNLLVKRSLGVLQYLIESKLDRMEELYNEKLAQVNSL